MTALPVAMALEPVSSSTRVAHRRHEYSSVWARAICDAFPDLDDLIHRGAMDDGLALAPFLPAKTRRIVV